MREHDHGQRGDRGASGGGEDRTPDERSVDAHDIPGEARVGGQQSADRGANEIIDAIEEARRRAGRTRADEGLVPLDDRTSDEV